MERAALRVPARAEVEQGTAALRTDKEGGSAAAPLYRRTILERTPLRMPAGTAMEPSRKALPTDPASGSSQAGTAEESGPATTPLHGRAEPTLRRDPAAASPMPNWHGLACAHKTMRPTSGIARTFGNVTIGSVL